MATKKRSSERGISGKIAISLLLLAAILTVIGTWLVLTFEYSETLQSDIGNEGTGEVSFMIAPRPLQENTGNIIGEQNNNQGNT